MTSAPAVTAALGLAAALGAFTLGGAASAQVGGAPVDVAVEAPRTATWDELGEVFDFARRLPDVAPEPDEDLLGRIEALLAADLGPRAWTGWSRLGDVWRDVRAAGEDTAAVDRVLSRLARVRALDADALELARELLRDDALAAPDWDPGDDARRDGLAFGPSVRVPTAGTPWREVGETLRVEQAVMLAAADLADWKAVENDYPPYLAHAGATYLSIGARPGTYVRGVDPASREFAALQIEFAADLPWPFGAYSCRLRILNHTDANGRTVCEVYSTSDDFHWLAGRDVYLSVLDGDGVPVGIAVVRRFGFDLDGVPDGADARRAGIRSGLGNLRLRAEARRAARVDAAEAAGEEGLPWRAPGVVPEFDVVR